MADRWGVYLLLERLIGFRGYGVPQLIVIQFILNVFLEKMLLKVLTVLRGNLLLKYSLVNHYSFSNFSRISLVLSSTSLDKEPR